MKPDGLTTRDAQALSAQHGPNSLPTEAGESLLSRLGRQFTSPLIFILLFALVVDLGLWIHEGAHGAPLESIAIGAILLLNALLGLWQEVKAENALARLRDLSAPQAWVLRDGAWARLAAESIVPGDQVRLTAGDRVPADGSIYEPALSTKDTPLVSIDESLLTGESLPVEKHSGAEAFSGTLVVRGNAFLDVRRIGSASALGKLAGMLGGIREESTPLERKMKAFGNRVTVWVLLAAGGMYGLGLATRGVAFLPEILLLAVSLAVAAVPEGLPAVLSLSLALGVERMAKRKAIVRRLAAVEALGSVTVIVTDKTGTLTENRMAIASIDSGGGDERSLLQALATANDATGDSGEPEDLAAVRYTAERGIQPVGRRIASQPFESSARFMCVTVDHNGVIHSYLKGAPEALFARSSLAVPELEHWRQRALSAASEGYRVLAVAQAPGESDHNVEILGLICYWDPPRPEVPDAIRTARAAGVRIVLATGDHPATAAAIASRIGFEQPTVRSGPDLDRLTPAELAEAVRTTDIFARVQPQHKLALIEQLQAQGNIVAMTGDGVNDAPALKRADIGIAMGQRGSDVTREVADLVLSDDNFATIVAAIEEGRGIYANVQKFVRFLFATNFAEIIVIAFGSLLAVLLDVRDSTGDYMLPLTAVQILWINLVTDGLPAVSLALDRDRGSMSRGPRPPEESILDGPSARFVLFSGSLAAAIALCILGLPKITDWSNETARTSAFHFLALVQLFYVYPARRVRTNPYPNGAVHLAVAAGCLLQLATALVPPLTTSLRLVPLDSQGTGVVMAAVLIAWAVTHAAARLLSGKPFSAS